MARNINYSSRTSDNNEQAYQEKALLQRLSQLSTSQQKRQQLHKIPRYLSNTNGCFQKFINEISSTMMTTRTTTLPHKEDLRQIAILMHKIKSEQIFQSL